MVRGKGREVGGGGSIRPGDGRTEELVGRRVVAHVAPAAPEDDLDPRELLVVSAGQVGGAREGGLGRGRSGRGGTRPS